MFPIVFSVGFEQDFPLRLFPGGESFFLRGRGKVHA